MLREHLGRRNWDVAFGFSDYRRSTTALQILAFMIVQGLVKDEEVARFSGETAAIAKLWASRSVEPEGQ